MGGTLPPHGPFYVMGSEAALPSCAASNRIGWVQYMLLIMGITKAGLGLCSAIEHIKDREETVDYY